jgi:hypothetical protein
MALTKQFYLLFEGLCAFKDEGGPIAAYLPSGMQHGANLIMPSDFLDLKNTTWMPTRIGTIYQAGIPPVPRQLAMWDLHEHELTITASGSGNPVWDKDQLLDLGFHNAGSKPVTKADIKAADKYIGIVNLVGPSNLGPTLNTGNFNLKKSTGDESHTLVTTVEWKSPAQDKPSLINEKKKEIRIHDDIEYPWACVTNAAPVLHDEALKHFEMYYIGVDLATGDAKITIERAFTNIFDCVPPVAWP